MIDYSVQGSTIHIETSAIQADIRTEGYTSGVAAGTFYDKKTGARDVGFGLSIVDFLLEPAAAGADRAAGQYEYGGRYAAVHGDIPKRYVAGPQICTQAKKLPFRVIEGDGFLVVHQWYTWHQGYAPHRGGSQWEQTLIFPEDTRYFFSADRVTTVNESPALFLRVDMPGHIKHRRGDTFEHVYLSYAEQLLPCSDFEMDFPPDGANLYQRGGARRPDRFIRAYQVRLVERGTGDGGVEPARPETGARSGPWLAGMTLEPADVYEAWCHQRGYVCMIQELGGWPTRPGDTFGAAYIVGWFDDLAEMHRTYDRYRGWSGMALAGAPDRPSGFSGLKQKELPPVRRSS